MKINSLIILLVLLSGCSPTNNQDTMAKMESNIHQMQSDIITMESRIRDIEVQLMLFSRK